MNNDQKACPICSSKKTQHERSYHGFELVKCLKCSFIFSNLQDEEITDFNKQHYDDIILTSYAQRQTFIDVMWFEKIVSKLTKNREKGKVLDIGCGNGQLLKLFIQKGWDCAGLDFSPWAKDIAEKNGYALYTTVLEEADIEKDSFDIVTSTSVLEHIAQPYEYVKEVFRILKPGGVAFFGGIPNQNSLARKLGFAPIPEHSPPNHVNYFTCKSLRSLFEEKDMKNVAQVIQVNSYGIPEMHKVYAFFARKSLRKTKIKEEQKKISNVKRKLADVTISVNHAIGKLFQVGDKLEAVIIKKE